MPCNDDRNPRKNEIFTVLKLVTAYLQFNTDQIGENLSRKLKGLIMKIVEPLKEEEESKSFESLACEPG